jgi:hypothetical protein
MYTSIFSAVLGQLRKSDVMTSFVHSFRSAVYHKLENAKDSDNSPTEQLVHVFMLQLHMTCCFNLGDDQCHL